MAKQRKAHVHLDSSVILTLFGFMLLGGAFLGFRMVQEEKCEEVNFVLSDDKVEVGQTIYVRDKTKNARTWEWSFGDEQGKSDKSYVTYIYNSPGRFQIDLLVNGKCAGSKVLTVIKPKVDLKPQLFPKIIAPQEITQGEEVQFIAEGPEDAESWEWRFGESASVDNKEKDATYTFKESGMKTISLIVNGRHKYLARVKINVKPKLESVEVTPIINDVPIIVNTKPVEQEIKEQIKEMRQQLPPPPPIGEKEKESEKKKEEKPKAPAISEADFANMLVSYSEGKTSAGVFNTYLCGNTNVPVVANGENMTWSQLIGRINKRKLKFKSMHIVKDQNNCIKSIRMETKKKIK